ncbi:MAG: hypothetical protein L0H15_00960 [Nitrosospira sp.]|nr:hypothetical protein [Nitrosospira sp.]MDN5881006.1 hypothetical protein [Nitrosospira sp.]
MKRFSISSTPIFPSLAFASALIFMTADAAHAQFLPGRPARGTTGAIIGNPPPEPGDMRLTQPDPPNTDPMIRRRDSVRERLNWMDRAVDLDRNGLISPGEAVRIPPGPPSSR